MSLHRRGRAQDTIGRLEPRMMGEHSPSRNKPSSGYAELQHRFRPGIKGPNSSMAKAGNSHVTEQEASMCWNEPLVKINMNNHGAGTAR